MTRILVAGAAGRLGREVVADLVARGQEVVAVDRDEEGLDDLVAGQESDALRAFPCELGDEAAVTRLAAELGSPLAVVDLTGETVDDPADHAACTDQVVVTLHLIAALGSGVERAVFGSCHTVGNVKFEGSRPDRPDSYHGAARLAGEKLWGLFGRNNGVPVAVLRLPSLDAEAVLERSAAAVVDALASGGGVIEVS
jgi:nucleoside-diphosphate-sugar epimerase